jgi:hypothetical protein
VYEVIFDDTFGPWKDTVSKTAVELTDVTDPGDTKAYDGLPMFMRGIYMDGTRIDGPHYTVTYPGLVLPMTFTMELWVKPKTVSQLFTLGDSLFISGDALTPSVSTETEAITAD